MSQNMNSSQRPGYATFAALVIAVYVFPVVLILTGVIPFAHRFTVLLLMAALVLVIERLRGRTWRELGFRTDTLRGSLLWNGAIALGLGLILLAGFYLGVIRPPTIKGWSSFYLFYVFISSPSQEFLFRSAIFAEMEQIGMPKGFWQVGVSAIIYAFPHLIYRDLLTMIVVLGMGVVWGVIYWRRPNWYGVAFSHAVLGALSIVTGLV